MSLLEDLISSKSFSIDSWPVKEVVITKTKGRGLVATKKITADEVIFEEYPLVCAQFLWNKQYGYSACDHCMAALETAEVNLRRLTNNSNLDLPHKELDQIDTSLHVRCSDCETSYCSQTCRDKAWQQYHQLLCLGASRDDETHPLNQLDELWKNVHFPPETASIHLITRMIAMVRLQQDSHLKKVFSSFCHGTQSEDGRLNHKLLGEKFLSQRDRIRDLLVKAVYSDSVDDWLTADGLAGLLALVGMNSQGVGTNPFNSWYRSSDKEIFPEEEKQKIEDFVDMVYEDIEKATGIQFMNNEGSALYKLQSACNHSCEPNVEVTFPFNNNKLALVALKDIHCDEEICISYLEDCQRHHSRHSRVKILRENYLFTCECEKCEEQKEDPDVTSSEDEDSCDD